MPLRTIQTVCAAGILSFVVASGIGSVSSMASEQQPSETKQEVPPVAGSKDSEGKVKEPETKPKEPDSKPKEPDSKPAEQKSKDSDAKAKESEPKGKDAESKPKAQEPKAKESTKLKEPEHKAKDGEPKSKEPDQKSKEPESKSKESDIAAEHPCPSIPQIIEAKPVVETPAPSSDTGTGERQKSPEPEAKKPVRSSMVTAKLALMADPHLFPYDIEVDAKDKDLVLLGKVGQETDKRIATDIIRCLEGVHAVENRLKVEADAAHGLFAERDKIITQLVKERFEKSKTLQSVKFDVKTEDGIVTLNGTTRFQIIVLEAAQAARQVPGVRAVNTDAVRLVAGE
jgi:hyperosmotically inducible protein